MTRWDRNPASPGSIPPSPGVDPDGVSIPSPMGVSIPPSPGFDPTKPSPGVSIPMGFDP